MTYLKGAIEFHVISWPDVIPAKTKVDQLVSAIDILPTICAATGANLPKNKIDGVNVLELLKNKLQPELEDRFFYYFQKQYPVWRKTR